MREERLFSGRRRERKAVFNSFGYRTGDMRASEKNNCDCIGGTLKCGVALASYVGNDKKYLAYSGVPSPVDTCVLRTEKNGSVTIHAFLVGSDGYLYYRRSDGSCKKVGRIGKGITKLELKAESGETYYFFSGPNGVYYSTDCVEWTRLTPEAQAIRGSCICGMRFMYAVKEGEVHYFAPLSPSANEEEPSNGAGVISLPAGEGDTVGIREFGGSAYVFLEKGIYRLTPAADARDFTMTKVEYAGGAVCLHSMISTGKGVLFMATDGLYIARGDKAERFCKHIPIPFCDSTYLCCVGRCEELFLLEFCVNKNGETEVKRLAIDAEQEEAYYTAVCATLGEDGTAALYGYIYNYVKGGAAILRLEQTAFESERLNFGTNKIKRLHRLRLTGAGSVHLCIFSGDAVWAYSLKLERGFAETRIRGRGKDFYFSIAPGKNAYVDGLEVTYTVEE